MLTIFFLFLQIILTQKDNQTVNCSALPLILFCLVIIQSCNQKEPCSEKNKEYHYLSSENKNWLEFSQRDTLIYDDSLGNIKFFGKSLNETGFNRTCDYYNEYWTVVYSNDSCPFKFSFSI
ncbi:MAG: hypothetical protein NTV09_09620, partial [Bacteroidetes bacterium]|nr:hypothetical protein [Bacteroidota bacterium]